MPRGKLIVFEGIDGSGKSTQADHLVRKLRSHGIDTEYVREPGSTDVGEATRNLLLDPSANICDRAEIFLFQAARAQLVDQVIGPAVDRGVVVVCDRFYHSTLAYQGAASVLNDGAPVDGIVAELYAMSLVATQGLTPDRTYLLDLPLEDALARAGKADRIEGKGTSYLEQVYAIYDLIGDQLEDVVRIPATGTSDDVHHAVCLDANSVVNLTRYGSAA